MSKSTQALAGKRIVVTRTVEQSKALVDELTRRGARVIVMPCVEFRPPENFAALDAELSRLPEFDWVAFTSQNAVRFFCLRLRELGRTLPDSASPKVAALGKATATAAAKEGLRVDFIAREARSGSGFASEFSRQAKGKKILLPQSDLAASTVADALRQAGANVTAVVAYRTCVPESPDAEEWNRVRREGADIFLFASPSAFHNFARVVGERDMKHVAERSIFAAIGPTTAQAIRAAAFRVGMEAAKPDPEALVDAMTEFFSSVKNARVTP